MDEPFRHTQTASVRRICFGCASAMFVLLPIVYADDQSPPTRIEFTDRLPYGQKPILYDHKESGDAVARLNERLTSGGGVLEFRSPRGYLRSLLRALKVPIESQVLVFSKTALNPQLIEPKNPRAVYFNDEVYVAWVAGAATIEVSAVDPAKGGMFYILKQDAQRKPRFTREERCLACHTGASTLHVPGHMIRSFITDDRGKPIVGYSHVGHETDFSKRFGGWYVTGTHGNQTHRGNIFGEKNIQLHRQDPSFGGNVTDLKPYFDVAKHLSPHSDIVAHLVLSHQAHGQNLITRVNYEARLRRHSDAEERLLRYLLFVDEAPLSAPVCGTSGFTQWFQKQGPRDRRGRSLRQFDLKTRLFKYRLSYLIHTKAFHGLPAEVKDRLYRRLWDVLTGKDRSGLYQNVPQQERDAIIAILRATKKDLPAYWK